jgi:hypothetical protein
VLALARSVLGRGTEADDFADEVLVDFLFQRRASPRARKKR